MKESKRKKSGKCCPGCLYGTIAFFTGLIFLFFIVIFVLIPVVFKYSIAIQRIIIFPTSWYSGPASFTSPESLGLTGVKNFYVTVNEKENISLGCWQILPTQVVTAEDYNYDSVLANKSYDILLYFHGNGGVRSVPLPLYSILRNFFHIIACDYRSYADSTKAELNENNVVGDIVNLYKWVRDKSKSRIFFWGHSLGTAVSVHTISDLKALNNSVTGLVLETPFSSVPDVMEKHYLIKVFSWLPYFRSTLIDPMTYNGFGFNSSKYIANVDCPIMILHAKDDTIVPYEFATKLYHGAVSNRNYTVQGNVTYHLFEAVGYDHMEIYKAPELPQFIRNFINDCTNFEKKQEILS